MPIYRHQCRICGDVQSDIFAIGAPNPAHCGKRTKRLMPTRVVGRVVGDSDGVHTGSGFASPIRGTAQEPYVEAVPGSVELRPDLGATWRPENRQVAQPVDTEDPTVMAPAPATGVFAKDYEDCTATERDSRWRDSTESVSAWMARQGEAKGLTPSEARTEANQEAQATITKARETNDRGDGLT